MYETRNLLQAKNLKNTEAFVVKKNIHFKYHKKAEVGYILSLLLLYNENCKL